MYKYKECYIFTGKLTQGIPTDNWVRHKFLGVSVVTSVKRTNMVYFYIFDNLETVIIYDKLNFMKLW